ncbi:MAG: hypothetical protein K8S18_01985 [Desulfobacula sp.]|nr:hypothetical protein [Desulfobacula sp.]
MKKRLLSLLAIVAAMAFIAVPAWAADVGSDEVNFLLDNPQEITISTLAVDDSGSITLSSFTGENTLEASWVVKSNNAFEIAFTGNSTSDDGSTTHNYPIFNKQDVDASGDLVTTGDNWDHMDTYFAVKIDGAQSTATDVAAWGGDYASTVTGEPAALTGVTGEKPYTTIGDIMTADADGTATVKIKAKGVVSDAGVQSGNYDMDVTLTVTAHEKPAS